jgi:hypothetical protein
VDKGTHQKIENKNNLMVNYQVVLSGGPDGIRIRDLKMSSGSNG